MALWNCTNHKFICRVQYVNSTNTRKIPLYNLMYEKQTSEAAHNGITKTDIRTNTISSIKDAATREWEWNWTWTYVQFYRLDAMHLPDVRASRYCVPRHDSLSFHLRHLCRHHLHCCYCCHLLPSARIPPPLLLMIPPGDKPFWRRPPEISTVNCSSTKIFQFLLFLDTAAINRVRKVTRKYKMLL